MAASPDAEALDQLLAPLRRDPDHSAILTDVDGTIAPIVADPSEARVPDGTRRLLRSLAERYALVGCLSGRRALDARRVVGLEELAYSGNHGFELLLPCDAEVRPDLSLDGHEADAPRFVEGLDRSELERVGMRSEDKGAIVALHWRGAPNEAAAESLAQEIASEAEWEGLVPHRGRKVLEIRPNVAINKGIAVAALIPARPIDHALYAGDDRTDVDAFAALRTLHEDGELETSVCIAAASGESPPEVSQAADATVPGPEGFLRVLEALAD
ncbi:MAG TPA: trehalose-phosphatase [Solirubrobacterales bacterium]|nr:trehalose-phosphatase [Solirubrobacterales bacterium]